MKEFWDFLKSVLTNWTFWIGVWFSIGFVNYEQIARLISLVK